MKIVLASSSAFRKMLLERLMLPFEVAAPNIDESRVGDEPPEVYVKRLAEEKARAVAASQSEALVIGSDQIAVHGSEIVGKPRDREHAIEQLMYASGNSVTLYTGLALFNVSTKHVQSDVVPFTVHFRSFDRDTAIRYLDREKPYACAGSLRAEGLGIALLSRFEGDDPNALIGLPLIRLVEMLEQEGVAVV